MKNLIVAIGALLLSFTIGCSADTSGLPEHLPSVEESISSPSQKISSSVPTSLDDVIEEKSENMPPQSSSSRSPAESISSISENKYSLDELIIISAEIEKQPFNTDDIVRHIDIKNGKVEITVENMTQVEAFLRDKPYKDAVLVIDFFELPYQKWRASIQLERNITDWQLYNETLQDLKRQIDEKLGSDGHGGIEWSYANYLDPKTRENLSIKVGFSIYAKDIDAAKTTVEQCLQEVAPSVGEISVRYVACEYSINELMQIKQTILEQEFYDEEILWTTIIGAGKLIIDMENRSLPLENCLEENNLTDSVKIRFLAEVGPNPLT